MNKTHMAVILTCGLIGISDLIHARSAKTYGTLTVKNIINVYDGDTFRADLNCSTPIVCRNISIRIHGVDTPEIRDKRPHIMHKAKTAKAYTTTLLKNADRIELKNIRRGKYFRIVADVYVDDSSLAQSLIQNGLGKPYFGGLRPTSYL